MIWNNISEGKYPIAYMTGDWDGKKSDPVLVEMRDDTFKVANLYEGTMDGSYYQEFISSEGEWDITSDVVRWTEITQ